MHRRRGNRVTDRRHAVVILSKDGTSYIHNLLFISNLYIEYKVSSFKFKKNKVLLYIIDLNQI